MNLSKRLQAIAGLIQSDSITDVGTDHAYLPIYLVESGKINFAVAADIRKGPLSRAEENIREHHLQGSIETCLSDGLSRIIPGKTKGLVIAGMGGLLICSILNRDPGMADAFPEWVLAPQSDVREVRKRILQFGRRISAECFVEDGGKFYPVIRAEKGDSEPLTDAELEFGPVLLAEKDETLHRYLKKAEDHLTSLLQVLAEKQTEKSLSRTEEIRAELTVIEEALNYYELQTDYGSDRNGIPFKCGL